MGGQDRGTHTLAIMIYSIDVIEIGKAASLARHGGGRRPRNQICHSRIESDWIR